MKRRFFIAAGSVGLVVLVVAALAAFILPSSRARREWKNSAITDISSRAGDPDWVKNELAGLAANGTDPYDPDTWLSPNLILMRNGDWLVYASVCHKRDRRIRDIFLARGSDGQWYYSTYHFCIGMINLTMNDQPQDLESFIKEYYLRTFDGQSDECLKKTWPP